MNEDKLDEMFLWGFLAGAGFMAVQWVSRRVEKWILDTCAKPRYSLATLKRIHQTDQEEAAHE